MADLPTPYSRTPSYMRSRWDFAIKETKTHQKGELIASTTVSIIFAIYHGFTTANILSGFVSGALTFFGVLFLLFLYHLLRFPRYSYYQQANGIALLQNGIAPIAESLPEMNVRVIEVFIHPSAGVAQCFVQFSLHNLGAVCDAPRDGFALKLTMKDGSSFESKRTFETFDDYRAKTFEYDVGYDSEGHPFERERAVKSDLLFPEKGATLKRGKPIFGWLGFRFTNLPAWPYREEFRGQHREFVTTEDGEFLDEIWIDDTEHVLLTSNVAEVSLTIIDPFEQTHTGSISPPFHDTNRRIVPVPRER